MLYKLGDINKHLGLIMTEQFVEQVLQIPKDGKEKRAVLYSGDSYTSMCDALAHLATAMRAEIPQALAPVKAKPKAPKAPKTKASSKPTTTAAATFSDDDEDDL